MDSLAQRIRTFRIKQSLSVSETARRIGVAVSTYREWEQGREIKGEPYVRMAEAFQVSLSDILLGSGVRESLIQDLEEIEKRLKRIKTAL